MAKKSKDASLKKKLKYVHIFLILFTFLTFVTSVVRAINIYSTPSTAIFRVVTKIMLLIVLIKLIVEYNKWAYILCLVNGYILLVVKLFVFSAGWRMFYTLSFWMVVVLIVDTVALIAYLVLGHVGLKLSKPLRPN